MQLSFSFYSKQLELDTSSCNDSIPYLFDVDSYIPDEESKVKVKYIEIASLIKYSMF